MILATQAKSLESVKVLLSDKHQSSIVDWDTLVGTKPDLSNFKCNPCNYNSMGKTAIFIAAELGLVDIFRLFLEIGIPYHVVDQAGNTPLHASVANGHVAVINITEIKASGTTDCHSDLDYSQVCQLILDAERDRIIVEIEEELGGAEHMQSEIEKTSSSFRGGIKAPCKSCRDAPYRESALSSMLSRRAWLRVKNYRCRSAAEVATREGHVALASLVESTCSEVYSQDFIDLQIALILQTKWGRRGSRSLSSLTAHIGSIRSLAPGVYRIFSFHTKRFYSREINEFLNIFI